MKTFMIKILKKKEKLAKGIIKKKISLSNKFCAALVNVLYGPIFNILVLYNKHNSSTIVKFGTFKANYLGCWSGLQKAIPGKPGSSRLASSEIGKKINLTERSKDNSGVPT